MFESYSHKQVRLEGRPEHRLHHWLPGGPNPLRHPVFCVHGLLRVGDDFGLLARRTGVDIYAADVRGRGGSGWGEPEDYRPDVYLADLVALMDAEGLEKVHWVGTSMGGIIGMLMAFMYPERIVSLTLNDIGPELEIRGMKRIAKYVGAYPTFIEREQGMALLGQIYAPFNLSPQELDVVCAPSLKQMENGNWRLHYDPAIAETFLQAMSSGDEMANLWGPFEQIKSPMLAIRGQLSDILTPETLQRMHQRAKAPLWSLVEPGVGHTPMLHKQTTTAALMGFWQQHDG